MTMGRIRVRTKGTFAAGVCVCLSVGVGIGEGGNVIRRQLTPVTRRTSPQKRTRRRRVVAPRVDRVECRGE